MAVHVTLTASLVFLAHMFVTMSGTLISVPHVDLTFRGLAIANDIVEDVNGARVWTALADTCGVATIRYHPTSGGKCDGDISCPRVITPLFNDSTFTSVLNVQRDYLDRLDHLIDGA
ncbi:hypothetical protein DFH06DRAFT_1385105 [Mycena polygramma]|nr:hypothetical protein DFH06DRAFT_1385105 [Mycena polygramma]